MIPNVDILEPLGSSDHNMVWRELDQNVIATTTAFKSPASRTLAKRDYKRADWPLFQDNLELVNWDNIFAQSNMDVIWSAFESAINLTIDSAVPMKVDKLRKTPVWETKKVRVARQERNKAK